MLSDIIADSRATSLGIRSLTGVTRNRASELSCLLHEPVRNPNNKPGGYWRLSWIRIDEQAVRRIGFRRPEPRIEAEPRPAIGAKNRVLLAHVDVDVRVIVRRRNADAVEFPDADSDLRDRAVVPELPIAAAGHRLRPL
jgi:hypothetical protein